MDIFIPTPCDHAHSMNYYTDQGIIGSYNNKTKVDSQWMFRRCFKCGVLQSAKLGKWKEDKKANDAFYFKPYQLLSDII